MNSKKYTKRKGNNKGKGKEKKRKGNTKGITTYLWRITKNTERMRKKNRASRRAAASRRASIGESSRLRDIEFANAQHREKLPLLISSSLQYYTEDPLLNKVENNVENYAFRSILLDTIAESMKLLVEGCMSKDTISKQDDFYISIFSKIDAITFRIKEVDIEDRLLIEKKMLEVVNDDDINCSQMMQLLSVLYLVYKKYVEINKNHFE
jgi:hypothetical protein